MFNRRVFFSMLAAVGLARPVTAAEVPLTLQINVRPWPTGPGVKVVYIDTPHGYISVMGDDDIPLMIWLMKHAGKAKLELSSGV